MIIDTHIHLDDTRYSEDLDEVLSRANRANVSKFIIPGADPKTLLHAIELSEKYKNIFFSVGVHPYDASNYDEEFLIKHINHPKCVAVGECGLDYFRLEGSDDEKKSEKELQAKVFISQINLAKEYSKPLIVHIRDASNDSKEILLKHENFGGVLHCYNADEQLLTLANHNFYFGVGGVATFKNAKKLIQVLPLIPKDKLLIETDGPYLTPHPHRGERNEPAYCSLITEKISEVLNIELKEVEDTTTKNALKLFW
ncbi:MAG: TatD family hydrolase [Campylobacterota bacterium]|nr:TatD family hydrolase [Campylobacterota bacterium]